MLPRSSSSSKKDGADCAMKVTVGNSHRRSAQISFIYFKYKARNCQDIPDKGRYICLITGRPREGDHPRPTRGSSLSQGTRKFRSDRRRGAGLLHSRGGAEDDCALRRQHAAIAVRDRGFGSRHLTRAALAAQLSHRLDQQEQPVHARVAVGQAAAVGVDRQEPPGDPPGAMRPPETNAPPSPFLQKPRSSRNRIVLIVNAS